MKVLAISASPRLGGNSEVLCDRFLEGAKEAGCETEKIQVTKKNISPCMACDACKENHVCVQKDDMAEIIEKMTEADVVVLSTPVYFYSISAQLKMVIDRCYSNFMVMGKTQFYYIVTAAAPDHSATNETVASIRGFLRCLPESEEKGVIYGTGAWDKGEILDNPAYDEAFEMGKNIK